MSNSRPLALCIVITATACGPSAGRSRRRRARRRTPAVGRDRRRGSRTRDAARRTASAAARSSASTSVAGPPARATRRARGRRADARAARRRERRATAGARAARRRRRPRAAGAHGLLDAPRQPASGAHDRARDPRARGRTTATQQGEPREPVVRLHDRVRQRQHVPYRGRSASESRSDGRDRRCRPRAAPAGSRPGRPVPAHEDRDSRRRPVDRVPHVARQRAAPPPSRRRGTSKRRPARRGPRSRRPRSPRTPTAPRHGSSRGASTAGTRAFTQSTSAACERKLRASVERLDRHAADAPRRCASTNSAHLGVAEAVDRLHRVADGEQRAAVAGLPSRRSAAQQLHLRDRRVLELVDEQVLEP